MATLDAMEKLITYDEWNGLVCDHERHLFALIGNWNELRKRKKKHAVIDFLFQYFSFPYSRLKAWTPGYGVALEGPMNETLATHRYNESDGIITLKEELPAHRKESFRWIINLLEKTAQNPACFTCYGLHEWAMVYKTDAIRHENTKLRVGQQVVCQVVEERELHCTHYDALRFYTPEAAPLNRFSPTRETQEDYEQSACLHANMDLYKWAYKLYPWISSSLLMRCFELAFDCRTVDMKASPYDLLELGYAPIKIETAEGKEKYVTEQLRLKTAAEPIRMELLAEYRRLLKAIS